MFFRHLYVTYHLRSSIKTITSHTLWMLQRIKKIDEEI